jgi:hypothetical protein
MPPGQDADQNVADDLGLAYDHLAHLAFDPARQLAELINR